MQEEKSSKVEDAKNMYFQKLRPCEACGALLSESKYYGILLITS